MDIKACVFDIDGTLVPKGKEALSKRTKAALDAVSQKGITLITATGRALFTSYTVLEPWKPDFYVCANGGLVANKNGSTFRSSLFTQEEMYALVDFCEDDNMPLSFIYEDGYYAYIEHDYFLQHYTPFEESMRFLHNDENQTRHLKSMPYGCNAFISEEKRKEFNQKYPHLNLSFVAFHGDHCDVLRHNINKAEEVGAVLNKLGISWSETIAFGDGNNDVEMLEHAGLSFAMDNGSQSAKTAAKRIAPPTSEDGVAQMLEKYILY